MVQVFQLKLKCEGKKGKRFFIMEEGAICSFSLDMQDESNFSLFKIIKFISLEDNSWSEKEEIDFDSLKHWFTIDLNDTGEFKTHIHIIFKEESKSNWEYVFSPEYSDESILKEDYVELENRKNILLFSLLSLVSFSILSVVVNIKKLTSGDKS